MDYTLRAATVADLETMLAQRQAMFLDMGMPDTATLRGVPDRARPVLVEKLGNGTYFGWCIEAESVPVAGAAVWLKEVIPGPANPLSYVAYVLGVYVHPNHRRNGLARRLMVHILDWCRARDITTVELHASDDGRPLYESMGFSQTNEMRRRL